MRDRAVAAFLALWAGAAGLVITETSCVRPRESSGLTSAELLKDHIVGKWTGRCTALNNCNGHGYCRPVTQSCICHNGWGGIDDIYDYASPDCTTRASRGCFCPRVTACCLPLNSARTFLQARAQLVRGSNDLEPFVQLDRTSPCAVRV